MKLLILSMVFLIIAFALAYWIKRQAANLRSIEFVGEIVVPIVLLEWLCFLLGRWLKWN